MSEYSDKTKSHKITDSLTKWLYDNDEDYEKVNIEIVLPKKTNIRYTDYGSHARDVMFYNLVDDIANSKEPLVVNKKKVFWKHGGPPIIELIEPTEKRDFFINKVIMNSINNPEQT